MTELSLNILDIAQNSIKANASLVEIKVHKDTIAKTLTIYIIDDGKGMDEETVKNVVDPFYTTRTTRKVGLGVPFFKMGALMTNGDFRIESKLGFGTKIMTSYNYEHIDMIPLGDMASTMMSLVSVNTHIDFLYEYRLDDKSFVMDTREIKEMLEGVPINSNEVLFFIRDFINENQNECENSN